MKELIESSVFIGVLISLASYGLGVWLRKKTGMSFMNPLLISIILVIVFLSLTGVSYHPSDHLSCCAALPAVQFVEKELESRHCRNSLRCGVKSGVYTSPGFAVQI